MVRLCETSVCNQEVFAGNDTDNYFGPDVVFDNCRLVLDTPAKKLTITKVKFINCDIQIKSDLKNFRWLDAFLDSCRFTGTLAGNDFGAWPEDGVYNSDAGLVNCNFEDAILDGCRFFGCDERTITFPKWPCFTILHPVKHISQLKDLDWPGKLSFWVDGLSWSPEETVAVTDYAPALAKQFSCHERDILAVVECMRNVIY